jgi:hypothetical protein
MKTVPPLLVLASVLALLARPTSAQTSVRPDPSGKRILFVDGDTIRPDPSGNRLLFLDKDTLRPTPSGPRLLFIDGDDIRPAPGGVRIAFWDGDTLRRSPGGPVLLVVDGGDTIRDRFAGQRIYFFDGPKLSRAQITAVLYTLKPELFKLSPGETAAKQDEMKKNAAAEDARLGSDQFPGERQITVHNTNGKKRTGSVVVTKQGSFYAIELKTGEEPAWKGVGIKYASKNGDQELWAGIAPAGATALGIYGVQGGALNGTWVPVNATDASTCGFENLTGSPQLKGAYTITAGKLPNGGTAYTGALNIDPVQGMMNGNANCYRIRWSNGQTALGFFFDNRFAAVAGWGADYEVLRLKLDQGALVGDFVSKNGARGYYTLTK